MSLAKNDLQAIDQMLQKHLEPIKEDIKLMKADLSLLASLNQLDDIRKEPRLRTLCSGGEDQQEA